MKTRVFGTNDDLKFWCDKPIQKGHPNYIEIQHWLIMIGETPVLFSNEDLKLSDTCLNIQTYQINGDVEIKDKSVWKKIIANWTKRQPRLINNLSKEDCQKIGWWNIEKLACETLGYNYDNWLNLHCKDFSSSLYNEVINWCKGFKAALSLNKMFTLNDVISAWKDGFLNDNNDDTKDVNSFVKQLKEPKIYQVELEMEIKLGYGFGTGEIRPKITNNSITVNKII